MALSGTEKFQSSISHYFLNVYNGGIMCLGIRDQDVFLWLLKSVVHGYIFWKFMACRNIYYSYYMYIYMYYMCNSSATRYKRRTIIAPWSWSVSAKTCRAPIRPTRLIHIHVCIHSHTHTHMDRADLDWRCICLTI